ncbi:hypothetical protein ANCCEY_09691 [Ancylostoma ceylanicum]|uniref:Uncharacterized protein n=1 Tax=Ancylostoma ceylanicum TaxID=53326 RepID=A0A0D6LJ30_9BILA|nr:hypothetical protein ANCCEY_09691 [Ancylostoma ceylanicum]
MIIAVKRNDVDANQNNYVLKIIDKCWQGAVQSALGAAAQGTRALLGTAWNAQQAGGQAGWPNAQMGIHAGQWAQPGMQAGQWGQAGMQAGQWGQPGMQAGQPWGGATAGQWAQAGLQAGQQLAGQWGAAAQARPWG